MSATIDRVQVSLGERSHEIEIGSGNLVGLGSLVAGLGKLTRAAIVTDLHVRRPHAETVAESLKAAGAAVDLLVVDAGEPAKSVETAARLWNELLALGVDRRSWIVAVGGGVVGDLAGFVAATFARGLALVQVPTTLLAQVDSSVGGKVGVNLPGAKNMVGAFWQPKGVLIDTEVLATLPPREYRSGLAEVVKYGVILDAAFFDELEANTAGLLARDDETLRRAIATSCRLKAQVVSQDEREESGLRAVLNFGHTFAHALETITDYGELLHGEAVSIGMVCAARLAERLRRVPSGFAHRLSELLGALGLPVQVPHVDHGELIALMSRDKKVEHGRLRFVLPTRLGHVELVEGVAAGDVNAALEG